MSTQFPDLFAALAAPFGSDEVKQRKGSRGASLSYITARTVMNRLDAILGPENWWDEYEVARDNSTLCRLTFRLPDGSAVTKQGLGVTSSSVGEDAEKGGESDALKRAAAKFGVGRYLYRDGVPSYAEAGPRPSPLKAREATWDRVLERAIARWHSFDPIPDAKEQTAREHRIAHELITAAVKDELIAEADVLKPAEAGKAPAREPARVWAQVKRLYHKDPGWVKRAIKLYLEDKQAEAGGDPCEEALSN